MIKKFKSQLLIFLLCLSSISLSTADELLEILGDDKPTEALFQEKQALTVAIRKQLKKVTGEQNIFLNFLDKNENDKALFQWWEAFSDTQFQSSPNGQALFSFLLFKNGLKINALEKLMSIKKVDQVMPELKNLFVQLAPKELESWKYIRKEWNPQWTPVFGLNTEIVVRSRATYDPKNTDLIFSILKKTKLNTPERAWMEWQMALGLALKGDVSKSAKVLSHLMKDKTNKISKDLVAITAARLLYQQGYLQPAVKYYNKVSKSSEYWFVAQEEKAWAYMRKGEPQNSLAVTQTLMVPDFSAHVGPEVVFLRALGELKVCDYPGVIKTVKKFKSRFKPRAQQMMSLIDKPKNEATTKLFSALEKDRVKLLSLGSSAKSLPTYVSRDEVLFGLVQTEKYLKQESSVADKLYVKSLAGGSAQIGFQAQLENFKKQIEARAFRAQTASLGRIKNLAQEELENINQILQKMHIVEAELVQQISQVNRVVSSKIDKVNIKKGSTAIKDKYALKFPYEGEVWFDELDNYNVDVKKGCQGKMEL